MALNTLNRVGNFVPHLCLITVMVKTCCIVLALCQFTGNIGVVTIHDTDTRGGDGDRRDVHRIHY